VIADPPSESGNNTTRLRFGSEEKPTTDPIPLVELILSYFSSGAQEDYKCSDGCGRQGGYTAYEPPAFTNM
jgi:hypothetical protein